MRKQQTKATPAKSAKPTSGRPFAIELPPLDGTILEVTTSAVNASPWRSPAGAVGGPSSARRRQTAQWNDSRSRTSTRSAAR
jgi:hypothetical protein